VCARPRTTRSRMNAHTGAAKRAQRPASTYTHTHTHTHTLSLVGRAGENRAMPKPAERAKACGQLDARSLTETARFPHPEIAADDYVVEGELTVSSYVLANPPFSFLSSRVVPIRTSCITTLYRLERSAFTEPMSSPSVAHNAAVITSTTALPNDAARYYATTIQ